MSNEKAINLLDNLIGMIEDNIDSDYDTALRMGIKALKQEPKTGHWIEGKYKDTCDKCRCTYPKNIGFKNYCPNCGAKMD